MVWVQHIVWDRNRTTPGVYLVGQRSLNAFVVSAKEPSVYRKSDFCGGYLLLHRFVKFLVDIFNILVFECFFKKIRETDIELGLQTADGGQFMCFHIVRALRVYDRGKPCGVSYVQDRVRRMLANFSRSHLHVRLGCLIYLKRVWFFHLGLLLH